MTDLDRETVRRMVLPVLEALAEEVAHLRREVSALPPGTTTGRLRRIAERLTAAGAYFAPAQPQD